MFIFDKSLVPRRKIRKKTIYVMVFNTTFNNISVLSWQPVLFFEETRVPGENQTI